MPVKNLKRVGRPEMIAVFLLAILLLSMAQGTLAQTGDEDAPGANNLIYNGNFEFGFYPVWELGFESSDTGNVPHDWNWFQSNKYGKYNIYNNEGFGLICADDLDDGTTGKNSLSLHMQSTDEADARLGVYQSVSVTPGQDYLFSLNGVIQVQQGGTAPDVNHNAMLYFDHTGNTTWHKIPHEAWTRIPWSEQELEFKVSGPDDPDLAQVEDYYEVVTAKSDTLTIFLMGWRRWANWRTGIFTFDCVSLVPMNTVNVDALAPQLSELSATTLDEALESSTGVQPAAVTVAEEADVETISPETAAEVSENSIIPPSGGILEAAENPLLIGVVSISVIAALVGAGVWNARRQK
jgi:hypothetical protein